MAGRCSVGNEGGRSLRDILLAVVPRVAVGLMVTAVSGGRAVETRHTAMETALLCSSVKYCIAPERRGDKTTKTQKKREY